ncbi:hypothetical protein U9R90_12795 [Streptomyces sp. E11-3]|uniref:hypothetical protein n=1 Tax=Streptomyces sp. E11-3 TaxID=3110112 RepID=UPI0039812188
MNADRPSPPRDLYDEWRVQPEQHEGRDGPGSPRLDALLDAAARPSAVDPGAEAAAVAAFRAAHESGVRTGRTRRRDDWRPRSSPWRRVARRAALGTLVAGLTVGGVAVAGIGVPGPGTDSRGERTGEPGGGAVSRPAPSSAPVESAPRVVPESAAAEPTDATGAKAANPRPGSSPSAGGAPPTQASDTKALCRAYENADDSAHDSAHDSADDDANDDANDDADRNANENENADGNAYENADGRQLGGVAWERLVTEAGGEKSVAAFCARELGHATGGPVGDSTAGHPTAGNPTPSPGRRGGPAD